MSIAQPTRQEKWAARNPLARWAHNATRAALKRGLIERRPCEQCGNPETDAHHEQYDRPLLVQWLCRSCHMLLHSKARKAEGAR